MWLLFIILFHITCFRTAPITSHQLFLKLFVACRMLGVGPSDRVSIVNNISGHLSVGDPPSPLKANNTHQLVTTKPNSTNPSLRIPITHPLHRQLSLNVTLSFNRPTIIITNRPPRKPAPIKLSTLPFSFFNFPNLVAHRIPARWVRSPLTTRNHAIPFHSMSHPEPSTQEPGTLTPPDLSTIHWSMIHARYHR